MAGLKRKFEGEIEVKVGGGNAFHEIFVNRPHHISNVHPELVQGCDLHEGDFGKLGSTICWRYTLDGKADRTCKQIIEGIDHEEKVIKFKTIDGDLLKDYKSFVITYKVIPKDKERSIVKWIFDYEKLHQGIPEPTTLMDALIGLAKEIDEYHRCQVNLDPYN